MSARGLSIEGEGGGEQGRSLRSGGSANELAASQILRTCLGYLYEGGDAKSFASIFQQSAEAYFREFPAGEQLPNEREAPPVSPSGVLGGESLEQIAERVFDELPLPVYYRDDDPNTAYRQGMEDALAAVVAEAKPQAQTRHDELREEG